MSKENLPLKVDPFRFADNGTCLQGSLSIADMQRLSGSLMSKEGEVDVDLKFGIDEQGIRFLRGHLSTHVNLQCQRCMEPFDYAIIDDFVLGIVQTEEEADELPGYYDPLVVKGADLFIRDVIEDELIVSLPIVPMHEIKECKVSLPLEAKVFGMSEVEKDSPFKVIEFLREKHDKK